MNQTNQQEIAAIAAAIAAGVEEINAYLTRTGQTKPEPGTTAYSVEQDGDLTWIKFPSRPANSLVDALQDKLDAHWSRKRRAWYITRPLNAAEVAAALGA